MAKIIVIYDKKYRAWVATCSSFSKVIFLGETKEEALKRYKDYIELTATRNKAAKKISIDAASRTWLLENNE